jgi:cell wall-active antibiotic response 4TMS protein YvqF
MSDTSTGPTDPTPTDPAPTAPYDPPPPDAPAPPPPAAPPTTTSSPLPPMAPPPTVQMRRGDPGRTGTVIFGVILVVIGLWFFADQTLGLEMPRLRISELWPLVLIVIGGWVLISSMRRGS